MLSSIVAVSSALGISRWFSLNRVWRRPAIDWQAPRILMYHMVRERRSAARFNKLRVSPRRFEEQVAWLSRNGFRFVFASELLTGTAPADRTVCLTFDDGYEDNLLNADPILSRYQARATLYLVTDRSAGWSSRRKSHHADDELQSEPKLSDDQVSQMLNSGRWELGGHTRTHANLNTIPEAEAEYEISEAMTSFCERFQVQPQTFAYPFGLYGDTHPPMVRNAGFVGAVTTSPGIASFPFEDPLQIPRIKVSGKDNLRTFMTRMRTGGRGVFQ